MNYDKIIEPPVKKKWSTFYLERFTKSASVGIISILVIQAVIILILFSVFRIIGHHNKTSSPKTGHVFTIDDNLSAILRSYDVDKVCYTGDKAAYFVHFDEQSTDENWRGWFYVDDFNFNELEANGTMYILGTAHFAQSAPDVAGLKCAESK